MNRDIAPQMPEIHMRFCDKCEHRMVVVRERVDRHFNESTGKQETLLRVWYKCPTLFGRLHIHPMLRVEREILEDKSE